VGLRVCVLCSLVSSYVCAMHLILVQKHTGVHTGIPYAPVPCGCAQHSPVGC